MEKWLLISNCQTEGLKNSLLLLHPHVQIDALDIWSFQDSSRPWVDDMGQYSRVIATTQTVQLRPENFVNAPNLMQIPNFAFRAFHPDICYVQAGSEPLFSPLHDYHSAICAAAYKSGYSLEETISLYNIRVFEMIGFFSLWDTEKTALINSYMTQGIDIRPAFLRWSRLEAPFMHVFNHPKIGVIYDVARTILSAIGIESDDPGYMPHDNLAFSSIFPVYPEIAERYGFRGGTYRFKPHHTYRTISLQEYVEGSFSFFRKHDRATLTSSSPQFSAAHKLFEEWK